MANNLKSTIGFTFRPRNENLGDYNDFEELCQIRGITISALLNSLLPLLNHSLKEGTLKESKTVTINGTVEIK